VLAGGDTVDAEAAVVVGAAGRAEDPLHPAATATESPNTARKRIGVFSPGTLVR
jgi:hypothetical protein